MFSCQPDEISNDTFEEGTCYKKVKDLNFQISYLSLN